MDANITAWQVISREPRIPHGVLTDNFVQHFDKYLDWELLSLNYLFTVEMLRIYFHRVNWNHILKRQRFTENILMEMIPLINNCCWEVISKFQNLSEAFIDNYKDDVDWEIIFESQKVSGMFLKEHEEYLKFIHFCNYTPTWQVSTTPPSGSSSVTLPSGSTSVTPYLYFYYFYVITILLLNPIFCFFEKYVLYICGK
jgi:hypothetical protein